MMINDLKKLFNENAYFFVPYLTFLAAGGYLLLTLNKGDFLLWLNSRNNPALDIFFKYATYFGDGLIICIATILLLIFYKARYSLFAFLGYGTSGILAQIIKRIANTPRPKLFFAETAHLHFVEGVSIFSYNSFLSGHSASAFSFFLVMSIITKDKTLGVFYFFAALLVALSRVYLAQHFFVDIYFGSILGVLFTIIVYIPLNRSKKLWMDKSLIKILQGKSSE